MKADTERVAMTILGEPVSLPWGQIAGLHFRRSQVQGAPVEGLLVRAEWRSAPGGDSGDLDFAEGAITAVSDHAITLATPYSGILSIPRRFLQRVFIFGAGRRYVIDATAHHLGDEVSVSAPVLDPPDPEGGVLERSIELAEAPEGPWALVLDVVGVVGEHNHDEFSPRVRNGEFRTNAAVNGKRIDYVNRHIKTKNDMPERVTMAIPPGLLHPGKNTIRLELNGTDEKDTHLDDLGVLQIALELGIPDAYQGQRSTNRSAVKAENAPVSWIDRSSQPQGARPESSASSWLSRRKIKSGRTTRMIHLAAALQDRQNRPHEP